MQSIFESTCRFCTIKKGGIGGSGRIYLQYAMDMAAVLAGLVDTGWTISYLVSSIPGTLGSFQSGGPFAGRRALTIENLLMSGCGQSYESSTQRIA